MRGYRFLNLNLFTEDPMTTSQYLTAWAMYYAAALGCLIVWWRITKPLNATFASWLRLIATVLLLTPGYTDPERIWMSPAMLAIGYEVLTDGPQGLTLNGLIVLIATSVALIIKALFFRKPLRFGAWITSSKAHSADAHTSVGESIPRDLIVGSHKPVVRYRERKPSSEPHIS